MGREAICRATFRKPRSAPASSAGRALLETNELVFRGEFRAKAPLASLTSVIAKGGTLTLRWREGTLVLELGPAAPKWADAIRNPRSVIQKLGVRSEQKVVALGSFDASFLADLAAASGAPVGRRASRGCDHVFLALATAASQGRLGSLREAIRPAGGIWVIYPKGRRDLSEDTVRAVAKRAGLIDIKVVRFSDTHGALRLVIPKAAR
jgi:hypothetical protein